MVRQFILREHRNSLIIIILLLGMHVYPQLLVLHLAYSCDRFSPMEHKRDATVAGLGWPSNPNRVSASTASGPELGGQASELCHPVASAPTTSPTSAPLHKRPTPIHIQPPHFLMYLSRQSQVLPTTSSIVLTSHHEWSTRSTSRSLRTPTIPGSYSSKRSPPRGSPNVVIPNTTSTVFRAIGSGPYALRIIGAITLRFL